MSVMVTELYEALRKVGVDETVAREAARAVYDLRADLVTKADLRAELAELKADLTWRMVFMTGVFVAAVSALRIFT